MSFNRINPNRSIPTRFYKFRYKEIIEFQSYQSKQINRDCARLNKPCIELTWFQSYQFRQINPDITDSIRSRSSTVVSIVSIQTDQSRRNMPHHVRFGYSCFNRINSDRSIPTGKRCIILDLVRALFQSYQFRQINPDERDYWYVSYYQVSIVSIQTDQSRRFWAWIWKTPIVVFAAMAAIQFCDVGLNGDRPPR